MPRLDISLLGQLQVKRDGQPGADLGYDKARALFAYLAVESDRPHRREALAALLWPDQPAAAAGHNLRQALTTLRRGLGDHAASPSVLLTARETVAFNPAGGHTLDVAAFAALLDACERHPHHRPEACAACAERRDAAVALYRGDFLAGFSPDIGAGFDDWVLLQRERLRGRCLDALTLLATYHAGRGAHTRARAASERQLALDPLRESAHRQLMRALWQSGERAAALTQYERCRRLLEDELGVDPEPETTALYQEIRAPQPFTTAGSPSPPPSGTQHPALSTQSFVRPLPEPPTPTVGRARDLEEIAARLADPACRLLTLVGPGGIGKTRLAVQTAREQAARFADGAAFVPLAPVAGAAFLVPAIADALGIALHGVADPSAQLLDRVRERELLLVLDNFEHLLDGAALVARLVAHAPAVTVLVTSRERLQLQEEWVHAVAGLSVPTGDAPDGFEGYGAVQLFAQSLRRARSQTPLRADERPWVVGICRLVEGMPLALELAAAWSAVLTLPEIAQEMERDLGFLATSSRNVPDQHRSMRAVFDRSWRMLSADEQAVFRQLAVFRGGFLRPAATELAGASLPTLAGLVNKSFLRTSISGRYDVHELLRQYGAERLAADPQAEQAAHDRHCTYYVDFLTQREAALRGRRQEATLAEIDVEMGNVRAAWRWATARARSGEIARAAHCLWLFYSTRGRLWESAEVFGRAVAALAGAEGPAGVPARGRALALGQVLVYQGSILCRLGRFPDAEASLDRGIALLRDLDAPRQLGLALNFRAIISHALGRWDDEWAILRESLDLLRAAGDDWGAAYSRNDLALVAHLGGDAGTADRLCRESLAVFVAEEDRRGQAFARSNLGVIAADAGRYEEATREHRAALALRRAIDDQWGIAASLTQLGTAARLAGNRHEAVPLLRDAVRAALDSGALPIALDALVELAALAVDDGREDDAREILLAAASHPACGHLARDAADRLLAGLAPQAPPPPAGDPVRAVEDLARALLGAPMPPEDGSGE